MIVQGASPITVDDPSVIAGKRVLVIEDGPTITHGGMASGAGAAISRRLSRELIDPRPYAVGSLKDVYRKYPHIGNVLPAMGYSEEQVRELEETIRQSPCDTVVIATPTDLRRKIRIDQLTARVSYDFEIDLVPVVEEFLRGCKKRRSASRA